MTLNINLKEIFSGENIKRLLKYALYMFLSLMAQNMLFTQLRPFGVCPLVLPAVAVAVGMFEGATFGAVFSLIMGIFADMAFIENTITFTVLFPALSFAAGFVSQFFINRRFFAFMLASLAALPRDGDGADAQDRRDGRVVGLDDRDCAFADAVVAAARRAGVLPAGGVDRVAAPVRTAFCFPWRKD